MRTILVQSARIRAAAVLGAWCAGVVLVRVGADVPPATWFALCGLCVAGFIVAKRCSRPCAALLLTGVMCISAGWTSHRITPSANQLDQVVSRYTNDAFVPIECKGQIRTRITTQRATPSPADPPRWEPVRRTIDISVHSVRAEDTWIPANGILRVVLPSDGSADLEPGELVRIIGAYQPPGESRNPGDPDWSALANQNARVGTIFVEHNTMIRTEQPDRVAQQIRAVWWRTRAALQTRAIRALGLNDATDPTHAMMGALILGQRDRNHEEMHKSFQRVGMAHMFAISGFHVATMVIIVVLLVRLFGEHPKIEILVVLGLILFVVSVLPLRPPIVRALLIVSVLMSAGGIGRRYDRVTILMWIALALLVYRPLDLFALGYQLSVGITALLLLMPSIDPLDPARFLSQKHQGNARSVFSWTWKALRTNAACWVVAMPAIMHHAGIISLLAPITAFVMLPIILAMMVVGYIQLFLGMISPNIGRLVEPTTMSIAHRAEQIITFIDAIPASSIRVFDPGSAWTIACTIFLGIVVLRPHMRRKRVVWIGSILVVVWSMITFVDSRNAGALRIDMLDVGNGSCYIIRSGTESVLFDAGSLDRKVDQTIDRAARAINGRPIRSAFVSHDNLDHFNALLSAKSDLGLQRVYTTDAIEHAPSPAWRFVRAALVDQGVEIVTLHAGDRLMIGRATVDVFWPPRDLDLGNIPDNNTSLVLLWTIETTSGPRSILMTGDIESETIIAILDQHPHLRADILEVPHHGSPHEQTIRLIETLRPSIVLQSTGRSRLNDPRLNSAHENTTWFTSADRGAAWVKVLDDGTIESGWFSR